MRAATKPKNKAAKAEEPSTKPVPVNLYFDPDLLEEVEDYRFAHRHVSRQDAIRELLRKGLDAK